MCCSYGAIIKIKYRAKSIKNKDGCCYATIQEIFQIRIKKGSFAPFFNTKFILCALCFILYRMIKAMPRHPKPIPTHCFIVNFSLKKTNAVTALKRITPRL